MNYREGREKYFKSHHYYLSFFKLLNNLSQYELSNIGDGLMDHRNFMPSILSSFNAVCLHRYIFNARKINFRW